MKRGAPAQDRLLHGFFQATLLAVGILCVSGCESLKGPEPSPLSQNTGCEPEPETGAGWWALGVVLQVVGPWLARQ